MMKSALFTIVIFLAASAYADSFLVSATDLNSDEGDGFSLTPGDFLPVPELRPIENSSGCIVPENSFRELVEYVKGIDPSLKKLQLSRAKKAVRRLRKKLGGESKTVLDEVASSASIVGTVKAFSTFEAVSHAKVSTAAAFLALYRKTLASAVEKGRDE